MSDMMLLHIEGATIEELRAKAVLALDIRVGAAAVRELTAEEVKGTPTDKIPLSVPSEAASALNPPKKTAVRRKVVHKKPAKKPAVKAAAVEPEGPAGIDDLKAAFARYADEFGAQVVLIDGPVILRRIYGDGVERIGQVPLGDPAKIDRVVAAVDAAIMTNEFKREVLTSGPEVNT